MIEPDAYIRATHRKNGLVRPSIRTVSNHQRPALPEVRRLSHHGVALVVLQPGGVDGSVIRWIHRDLRIKPTSTGGRDLMRRLPRVSIIVAHHQNQSWQRAARTARDDHILRIKNVHMTVTIGGDRRLPLIPDRKADAGLRSEARIARPCSRRQDGGQQYRKNESRLERKAGTHKASQPRLWKWTTIQPSCLTTSCWKFSGRTTIRLN